MNRLCLVSVLCLALLYGAAAQLSPSTLRATSWCTAVMPAGTPILISDQCGAAAENAFTSAASAVNIILSSTVPDTNGCITTWARYVCATTLLTNGLPTINPAVVGHVTLALFTNFTTLCGTTVRAQLGGYWNGLFASTLGTFGLKADAATDTTPFVVDANTVATALQYPRCSAFNPAGSSLCSTFIPNNQLIYSPAGRTQASIAAQLAAATSAVLATNCTNCRNSLLKLMCNTAFPKCVFPAELGGLPAAFFNFPDRTLCTDAALQCSPAVGGLLSFTAYSAVAPLLGFSNCAATVVTQVRCNATVPSAAFLPNQTFPSFPTAATKLNGLITLQTNTGYNTVPNQALGAFACPFRVRPDHWCYGVLNPNQVVLALDKCAATNENAFFGIQASINMIPDTEANCKTYWAQWTCTVIMGTQLATVPNSVCTNLGASCSAPTLGKLAGFWNNVIRPNSPTLPLFAVTPSSSPCIPDVQSITQYVSTPFIPAPKCEYYTGQFCKNFIPPDRLIYVPKNFTQQQIENLLLPNAYAILLANRQLCRDKLLKLICLNAFPGCAYPLNPLNAAFFNFPDRTVCEDAKRSCSVDVSGQNTFTVYNTFATRLGFGNCSALTTTSYQCNATNPTGPFLPLATFPSYPNGRTRLNPAVELDSVTGYPNMPNSATPSGAAAATSSLYQCPEPTTNIPDSDTATVGVLNTTCAPRCPSLLYTADTYKNIDVMMGVITAISLTCQSVLMFTYAAFKKTRRSYYTIFFSANLWLVSLVLFFSICHEDTEFGRYANMRCTNRYTPSTSRYCLFQALIMVFTGLSAVAWWFLQALDLYLQIRWNARKWGPDMVFRKNICYYIWGWGWPACALIAAGASENLGNAWNGIAWCFIIKTKVSWGLFYGPVGAQAFGGAVMMGLIILSIYQSSTASGAHKRKGWWRIYIRPLIFVAVFLICWGFVFAYRFSEHFNEDKYLQDATSWIQCELVQRPSGAVKSCDVRPSPNLGLFWLIQADIAAVGILGFLVYNTNENFVMWYHYITCKKYNFSRTTGDSQSTGSKTGSKNVPMTKQPTKKGKSAANLLGGDSSTAGHSRDPSAHSLAGASNMGSGSLHYGDSEPAAPASTDGTTQGAVIDPPSQV